MSLQTTARKYGRDVADVTRGVVVRSRHGTTVPQVTSAAATGNAWSQSPTVDNRVRRTISDDNDGRCGRLRRSDYGLRHIAHKKSKERNTKTTLLKC